MMVDVQTEGQKSQPRRQPGSAAAPGCGNEVTGFQIADRGSQIDAAVCCLCRSHCVSTASRQAEGEKKKSCFFSLTPGQQSELKNAAQNMCFAMFCALGGEILLIC